MLNLATLLRESAKAHPAKPAVIVGDTTLRYGELHGFAQRFGGALKSLGVTRGKHVALMLPNVPQFTIAYYGTHYAGGAVVPLNVLLTADEIAYHLEDSDAVTLVVWEGFLEQAQAAFARVDSCKHLIVAKGDPTDLAAPEGVENMTALIGTSEPLLDLPDTMPDDTAVILYTSGTTGRPKGAELTQFNMFFNALYVRRFLLPIDESTVSLATLPLFHSFGQTAVQNATIAGGGTLVLLPRFDAKAALDSDGRAPGDALRRRADHVLRAPALPGGGDLRPRAPALHQRRRGDAGRSDEGLRPEVRRQHPGGLRLERDLARRLLQRARPTEEGGLDRAARLGRRVQAGRRRRQHRQRGGRARRDSASRATT